MLSQRDEKQLMQDVLERSVPLGIKSKEKSTVHQERWIKLCELALSLNSAQIKFEIDRQMI